MADDTLAGFDRKLAKITAEFEGPQAKAKLNRIGKAGAADATGVVRQTIGDLSMSHWRRKKPIDLSFGFKVVSSHEVEVRPALNQALGPERVLNDGRNAYRAGDRRLTGKLSKKTGKALSRVVKRNTGAHGGKHTWDRGKALIERRTPSRVHDEVVTVLKKQFGG